MGEDCICGTIPSTLEAAYNLHLVWLSGCVPGSGQEMDWGLSMVQGGAWCALGSSIIVHWALLLYCHYYPVRTWWSIRSKKDTIQQQTAQTNRQINQHRLPVVNSYCWDVKVRKASSPSESQGCILPQLWGIFAWMEHKRCPHTCKGGVSVGLGVPAGEVPVCLETAQSQLAASAPLAGKRKSLCPWYAH